MPSLHTLLPASPRRGSGQLSKVLISSQAAGPFEKALLPAYLVESKNSSHQVASTYPRAPLPESGLQPPLPPRVLWSSRPTGTALLGGATGIRHLGASPSSAFEAESLHFRALGVSSIRDEVDSKPSVSTATLHRLTDLSMSCVPSQQEGSDPDTVCPPAPITHIHGNVQQVVFNSEDAQYAQLTVPERHVGALQDLTGQPVGGPAYPSRNVANSSLPLCLLRGKGGGGISIH